MRRLVAVMGAVLLGGWWPQAAFAAPGPPERSTYIVVLRAGAGAPGEVGREHAAAHGGRVTSVYEHALRGYAAELTPQAAARVARDRRVESVGPDRVASVASQDLPTGVDRASEPALPQSIDHGFDLDGNDEEELGGPADGRVDADIAVIDTAVDARHPDLDVLTSVDCTSGTCVTGTGVDGNGHGTHVAGVAAALDNDFGVVGVAPGARIWSVKVLSDSGSGSLSWILAGVDWVTARAGQIEVANLSLGCACSSTDPAVTALLNGVSASVAAGVTYTAAAGNLARDAATYIPGSNPDVITVSALVDFDGVSGGSGLPTCRSEIDDTLADFSNYGDSVEMAAPGGCILSTWPLSVRPYTPYHILSGTSMAAPHVAGAAALLASQPTYRGQPAKIRNTLVAAGNFDWTDDSGDRTQEPLLDVTSRARPPDDQLNVAAVATPVLVPPRRVIAASVANLWHHEVDDGTTSTAAFTITLSSPPRPGQVLTVNVATANSTATAPADYTSLASTTVTFTEGDTAKTVEVTVKGDALAEGNEVFLLNLSSPTGGLVLADTQASATIVDNEAQLYASVEDLTVAEPASGTTAVTATVVLSGPATHTVKLKVATANSGATAGSDYTAVPSTTLTFLAGEQNKPVTIDVHADSAYEGNESFLVKLSGPTGGLALSDASATVTIVDAHGPLTATVADVVVTEGDDATTSATFTITLSAAPVMGQVVSLKAATSTAGSTATAGSEYAALPSSLVSFGVGDTVKTVTIDVFADAVAEPNETFVLNLSAPTGGLVLGDSQAVATIVDDDTDPPVPGPGITASVANLWHHEGDDGTTSTAAFTITLSAPPAPGQVLTLKAATANSSATAPADYTSLPSTTVTFSEGETAKTVEITVKGDALAEGNEVFLLNLSSPTGGLVLADTQASATVVDRQGPLYASVDDLTVAEPASGTTAVTATVALSAPATHTVKVKVSTANSTATAGSDYTAVPSTTLTFLAGEQTKRVTVDVHGDSGYEGNESFLVKLSGPTGGLAVSDALATVTIVDAQGPLTATVADVVVAEGDDGITPATFTIALSAAPIVGQVVSLKVATGVGTAQADADYTPVGSTTVSFVAGEYQKTITVDVLGDLVPESTETFVLNLTSPTGGLVLADGQATGTIRGDD